MKKVHFDLREKSKSNFELHREFNHEYEYLQLPSSSSDLKLTKGKSLPSAYRQSYRYNAKPVNGYFLTENQNTLNERMKVSSLNSRNQKSQEAYNGKQLWYKFFNSFSKKFKQIKSKQHGQENKSIFQSKLFNKKLGQDGVNKSEIFYCYV